MQLWKCSGAKEMPRCSLWKQNLPKRVMNVVSKRVLSQLQLSCRILLLHLAWKKKKTFVPERCPRVFSGKDQLLPFNAIIEVCQADTNSDASIFFGDHHYCWPPWSWLFRFLNDAIFHRHRQLNFYFVQQGQGHSAWRVYRYWVCLCLELYSVFALLFAKFTQLGKLCTSQVNLLSLPARAVYVLALHLLDDPSEALPNHQ